MCLGVFLGCGEEILGAGPPPGMVLHLLGGVTPPRPPPRMVQHVRGGSDPPPKVMQWAQMYPPPWERRPLL